MIRNAPVHILRKRDDDVKIFLKSSSNFMFDANEHSCSNMGFVEDPLVSQNYKRTNW